MGIVLNFWISMVPKQFANQPWKPSLDTTYFEPPSPEGSEMPGVQWLGLWVEKE